MSKFQDLQTQIKANEGVSTPMPQYQSHKKVWALKIKEVIPADRPTIEELDRLLNGDRGTSDVGAILVFDGYYGPLAVSRDFVSKHAPQAGGYYVMYQDGYVSWSPAEAFESGYTRV